ncbi:MAG: M24 family metallopeptidase [Deltaproteobacteria bacterium]|nr:MAG: M24 family metallopeptidase [Deltaproteobacteria bacterium]
MHVDRQQRAVALLAERDLDALLFFTRENLRHLCGFTGSDGVLLLTAAAAVFLTDSRYTTQAGSEVTAARVEEYRLQGDGVIAALRDAGVRRIGFESSLSYGKVSDLRAKGESGWEWLPLGEELDGLRLVKSAEEVAAMDAAAALNAEAFAEVEPLIRPGAVERDLALALEFAMKRRGAEEKAFDFIVASGPRGALPHGVAADRRLAAGELVTIDFGCRVDGYHSDETVTVALGDVDSELRQVFDTVLTAHDLALAAVMPGVPLAELDRIARDHIAAAGYGAFFGHGLGHGVGLAIHEAPTVSMRSKSAVREGMVFTIEPGVYLPGRGGVRIEDTVVATASGARVLTRIPKQFRNLLA